MHAYKEEKFQQLIIMLNMEEKKILSTEASVAGTEFISLQPWGVKCILLTQATSASFFVFYLSNVREQI